MMYRPGQNFKVSRFIIGIKISNMETLIREVHDFYDSVFGPSVFYFPGSVIFLVLIAVKRVCLL